MGEHKHSSPIRTTMRLTFVSSRIGSRCSLYETWYTDLSKDRVRSSSRHHRVLRVFADCMHDSLAVLFGRICIRDADDDISDYNSRSIETTRVVGILRNTPQKQNTSRSSYLIICNNVTEFFSNVFYAV